MRSVMDSTAVVSVGDRRLDERGTAPTGAGSAGTTATDTQE